MAIRRGKRPDARFYTVSKDVSEDARLSWAARGMLIFLLGKPDNWTVSVAHLIKQTEGSQRSTGRDGVRAIIKELMDTGYMQADGVRTEGGTFGGMNYVVNESPETDLPSPVKPHKGAQKNSSPETPNPAAAKPTPVNPLLIKTDHQQRLKEIANTDISDADKSAPVAGGVLVGEVLLKGKQQEEKPQQETEFQLKCRATWKAYAEAYCQRYGTAPIRNAKVNSQVKQLVQRLGTEAAEVAAWFVLNCNDTFIVRKVHDLGLLVSSAEGYRTQCMTGRAMTNTRASQIDQTAANFSAADEAKAMLRAKRERERAKDAD